MPRAWLSLAALAWVVAESAAAIELEGTWYVLVHYKDSHAANADTERWEDRVWVFEREGKGLRWTEYPIVVFDDESGRFERRQSGQYARIMHFWEPDQVQLADIGNGLQVNTRGVKTKSLRGSPTTGWSSVRRAASTSASVIGYEEVWSIEGTPTQPIFRRSDLMGGGRTDTLEGITEYATRKVENGVLSGVFERDGSRHGVFRMLRSGAVGAVKGAQKQEELQRQAAIRGLSRGESREEVEKQVREGLAGYGLFLGDSDVESLVTRGFELASQGVPVAEIERRLGEGLLDEFWRLAPPGAAHDAATRYRFPYEPSTPRQLVLGVGSEGIVGGTSGRFKVFEEALRHAGWSRFAFNFSLPVGSTVLAARGGEVIRVIDGFDPRQVELQGNINSVWVLHADGSVGVYMHLKDAISLRPGDRVEVGDPIGKSGALVSMKHPVLYFSVIAIDAAGDPQTVDIRFDDGSAEGLVPVAGRAYPGG